MKVIVITSHSENADPGDWPVVGVAVSREAAVACVKKDHAAYPIKWREHGADLIAEFGDKPGLCCEHEETFNFEEYEVK